MEVIQIACLHLKTRGISAAGRTALHFDKNYPNRLMKLILESAVTCEAWPDLGTRIGAMLIFNRFVALKDKL